MITSNEADDLRIRALEAGATDFLPKRPHATELSVRLRNLIKLGASVRKLNNQAACLANEVAAATQKLQEREEEIILRLALAVEYRDNDTGEHTLRVAKYSRIIAEQLDLSPRLCRDIYLAAPLHDVGKVAIPDTVRWVKRQTTRKVPPRRFCLTSFPASHRLGCSAALGGTLSEQPRA